MKTTILILLILITASSISVAQKKLEKYNKEKILIEINYGFAYSKPFLKGETLASAKNDVSRKSKPQYSIGLSGQLHKFFYLKTVLGTNNFDNFLDVKFRSPSGTSQQTMLSYYLANYIYLSVLPEIRFSDLSQIVSVYANAGISAYTCTSSEFYNNLNSVSGIFAAHEMAAQFRGNGFAFETNAGFNFKYKGIGVNFAVGYVNVGAQKKDKDITFIPALGFKQFRSCIGVVYNMK